MGAHQLVSSHRRSTRHGEKAVIDDIWSHVFAV